MTDFQRKVYALTAQIPTGSVTTYKLIAEAMDTKAYQAIGSALRDNPFAPQVPCHRVIKSDGTIGGFKGHTEGHTIAEKKGMLESEGIVFDGPKVTNYRTIIHQFK